MTNTFMEDNSSSKVKSVDSGSHVPEVHDTEVEEKANIDEGTLCWNLLMSRLFFDAKSNLAIKNSLKDRIQVSVNLNLNFVFIFGTPSPMYSLFPVDLFFIFNNFFHFI